MQIVLKIRWSLAALTLFSVICCLVPTNAQTATVPHAAPTPASGLGKSDKSGRFGDRQFTYDGLSTILLSRIPELNTRPAHFVFVFDRTDSVNGVGSENGVLAQAWQSELLGKMLADFMVEGREVREGDRVSIFGFGRHALSPIVSAQPYKRSSELNFKASYPKPFRDTPPNLQGSDFQTGLNQTFPHLKETSSQNTVVLFVCDDRPDGKNSDIPAQAGDWKKDFIPFVVVSGASKRTFVLYMFWNSFPDNTIFTHFDGLDKDVPQPRRERVQEQTQSQTFPPSEGTNVHGAPAASQEAAVAKARQDSAIAAANRKTLIEGSWIAALSVLLLAVLVHALYSYYRVQVSGLVKNVRVLGPKNKRRVFVPDPNRESQSLGYLEASGLPILGLHRLRFHAAKGYKLVNTDTTPARGPAARRRNSNGVLLKAGAKLPVDNIIHFQRPPDDTREENDQDNITLPVQRKMGASIVR